jgi:hypothetical protein
MINTFFRRALVTAVFFGIFPSPLMAGPPLAIDDPGILDPGQWEIIVAATMASTNEGEAYQAPLLDVSYGLTPNTQVGISLPYVFVSPDNQNSTSEFGNLAVGYKWRFINNDKLQVAFAPAYAFGIRLSAALRGVGDDTNIVFLPLELQYEIADWSLNGEWGYVSLESGGDGWGYGAALSRPVGQRTVIMFEIYGGADTGFDNDDLNFHIGFDTELRPDFHLLFAAGSGLREPAGATELDFDIFLGLQYFR